jgi:DMSO/TMAO reductase YedYZ molybdopterin-dependent catalytic subunit
MAILPYDRPLTRRQLLAAGVTAAAGAAAAALSPRGLFADAPFVRDGLAQDVAAGLVIRNERPLDAETPLDAMGEWRTSTDHFFVRSHFGPPSDTPLNLTLVVDGEVGKRLSFTLDDLSRMATVNRPVTLECAGNGRGRFDLPNTSGVQWQLGAVSNAEWRGVPLGELLDRAKVRPSALHFWMEATDHAPNPVTPPFYRSLPRDVALSNAFIAIEMNGAPVPLLHGGPFRLIVPGWFGMASTKWLANIHARATESDNQFMAKGYRYPDGSPVQQMRVKSLISSPVEGARVSAGVLPIGGLAWSGAGSGGIRGVDVSIDGGKTWRPARLLGPEHPDAWRSWAADVTLTQDTRAVRVRATDKSGASQPDAASANPAGYANNSIHEVGINVIPAWLGHDDSAKPR